MFKILVSLGSNIYSKQNIDKARRMLAHYFPDVIFTPAVITIEDSEEKIVVNRLNNILRDKPAHQNKFDFQEYKTGAWSEFNDYKLAVRFSNAKTELSEKHFEKTGEYMTSRGIAKLTGFNPANIKNMLQHKRAIVKKMLITLEKLAKEY